MDILTLFVLPIATMILAVVFEKIVRLPILTGLTAFAIFLIVAYTAFDSTFLVYTIVYTILAYLMALIAEHLYTNCRFSRMECRCCCNNNNVDENSISNTVNEIINSKNIELTDKDTQKIAERVANVLMNGTNCR